MMTMVGCSGVKLKQLIQIALLARIEFGAREVSLDQRGGLVKKLSVLREDAPARVRRLVEQWVRKIQESGIRGGGIGRKFPRLPPRRQFAPKKQVSRHASHSIQRSSTPPNSARCSGASQ